MFRHLRDVADVYYGRSPKHVLDEDGAIPVIGTGGLYGRAAQSLFTGPAIVVPRKGSLGNPQYIEGPFWPVDTTYAVLPKCGIDAKWLYYSLDLFDLTKLNEATGVPSISRDWLNRVPLGGADSTEQKHIAEILTTIDEAIEQTEAMIAKTRQIKAGLMHDLFTRGVTPDGHLRPSRDERPDLYRASLLGWVPDEWVISTLGNEARFASGYAFKNHELSEDGTRVVRISNLHKAQFPYWFYDGPVRPDWVVKDGDLLFSWAGVASSINVHIYRGEAALLNQHIYNLRLHEEERQPWVFHWLKFRLPKIREEIEGGAGQLHLTKSRIQGIEVPLPPKPEMISLLARARAISEKIELDQQLVDKLTMQKEGVMRDLLLRGVSVCPSKMLATDV